MRQYVNWYVWGYARYDHGPLWRTFLTEQRALSREAGGLALAAQSVHMPVLLVADPGDTLVPIRVARNSSACCPTRAFRRSKDPGTTCPCAPPAQSPEPSSHSSTHSRTAAAAKRPEDCGG